MIDILFRLFINDAPPMGNKFLFQLSAIRGSILGLALLYNSDVPVKSIPTGSAVFAAKTAVRCLCRLCPCRCCLRKHCLSKHCLSRCCLSRCCLCRNCLCRNCLSRNCLSRNCLCRCCLCSCYLCRCCFLRLLHFGRTAFAAVVAAARWNCFCCRSLKLQTRLYCSCPECCAARPECYSGWARPALIRTAYRPIAIR